MGLFSKLSSSSKKSSSSNTNYAPPPGPPPPQQGSAYGTGAQGGGAQPHYYQQQHGAQQPPQQQQQQQWQRPQQQGYAAPSQTPPQEYYQPPAAGSGREDPLQALKKYDTVFLVDDSGSMEMFWVSFDLNGRGATSVSLLQPHMIKTQYPVLQEDQLAPALAAVIQTAIRYDDDGVDIYFFNSCHHATSRSAPELLQLFQKVWPSKSTPTASALRRVLDPYVSNLENWVVEGKPSGYPRPKPMNLIVLTDGAPDRGESAEPVIVEMAQRLDKIRMPPFQLGIQFVQIGTDDEAAQSLRSLDDDLREKHGIRDIVDTTLFDVQGGQLNVEYLMKALLGGMNRSVDNQ